MHLPHEATNPSETNLRINVVRVIKVLAILAVAEVLKRVANDLGLVGTKNGTYVTDDWRACFHDSMTRLV